MIEKKIHYCWFGGKPKPELAEKCIESWKEHCPDYQLVEWNEENFDINSNLYVKQAYEAKKFAFVTDYVRLYALYTQGGVYMDTDVMVLRSLDKYLEHEAFSGFESKTKIPTGIMAAEKGCPLFAELLSYYDTASFLKEDGSYDLTTNVEIITKILTSKGFVLNGQFQVVEGMAFYTQNIFCPEHKKLNDKKYMKDTATIHYFAGSWKSEAAKKRENSFWWKLFAGPASFISGILRKIFGDKWEKKKNSIRDKVLKEEDGKENNK